MKLKTKKMCEFVILCAGMPLKNYTICATDIQNNLCIYFIKVTGSISNCNILSSQYEKGLFRLDKQL